MAGRVVVSLHQARLGLTDARDDFSTGGFSAFARSYLEQLLVPADAEANIEVALEWGAVLPAESRSGLEQLGRRIWAGPHRLQHAEILRVPGLQMDIGWRDGALTVHAAYTWPTRRARWFAAVRASARERLFVSLIYYLVYFPCAWWLERERGWTLLHASAIATPEGGLVLSGLPGCGKSTAALAALNVPEWQIVSDNLLFTDGSQVFACPEPIHVDARTRALVGDGSTEASMVSSAEPLAEVLAGRVRSTGRRFSHQRQDYEIAPQARRSSTTPLALGFLHVGRETAVRHVDQAVAVRRLMANDCLAKEWMAYQESAAAMHAVWPGIGDQERRWGNLAALVRSIPCYDVTIARNGPVPQAVRTVTQVMLDGSAKPRT